MNKKLAATIRYVVFAGIAIALIWFIFRDQNIDELLAAANKINYWWIGISMLVSVPAYVIRAARWNLLLKVLGYNPSLLNATKAVSMGYLFNLAFPRLGEVTRCTVLNRQEKIPLNTLIGTVVAERAIDVLCLLLIIFFVALAGAEMLGKHLNNLLIVPLQHKLGQLANNTLLMVIIAVIAVAALVTLRILIRRSKFGEKIKAFIVDFTSGITSVFRMKKQSRFWLLTILLWSFYFAMMYVCYFGIPELLKLSFIDSLFVFVLGSLGMAAPTPGGAGTYELTATAGFTLVGVAAQDGLVMVTVFHISQILTSIILGTISLLTLSKSKKPDGQTKPAAE